MTVRQEFEKTVCGDFVLFPQVELSRSDIEAIVEAIHSSTAKKKVASHSGAPLSGRGKGIKLLLPDARVLVFIKKYSHGGLTKLLFQDRYLAAGKSRSQKECEILHAAKSAGVKVPAPVCAVEQGGLFKKLWIVTEFIQERDSLISLSEVNEGLTQDLLANVAAEVMHLVSLGIYHSDFHPGNIIATASGATYIVDFDKAYQTPEPKSVLRDKYLCRWRRAVLKHNLSHLLIEGLSIHLRKNV